MTETKRWKLWIVLRDKHLYVGRRRAVRDVRHLDRGEDVNLICLIRGHRWRRHWDRRVWCDRCYVDAPTWRQEQKP